VKVIIDYIGGFRLAGGYDADVDNQSDVVEEFGIPISW
jgi:hypothetical protein